MFHGGFIGIGISLCWALKVWYILGHCPSWWLHIILINSCFIQSISLIKLNTHLSFTYIPTHCRHNDSSILMIILLLMGEVRSSPIYFCPPQRVKFPKLSKEVYLDQCWSVMLCSSLSNSSNSPHVSVFGVFLIKAVPPYTRVYNSAASCGPKRKCHMYKSIFWQKFKILHIFRGLCIISTFCLNFCTTNNGNGHQKVTFET